VDRRGAFPFQRLPDDIFDRAFVLGSIPNHCTAKVLAAGTESTQIVVPSCLPNQVLEHNATVREETPQQTPIAAPAD
jgi:hypothetical protein